MYHNHVHMLSIEIINYYESYLRDISRHEDERRGRGGGKGSSLSLPIDV